MKILLFKWQRIPIIMPSLPSFIKIQLALSEICSAQTDTHSRNQVHNPLQKRCFDFVRMHTNLTHKSLSYFRANNTKIIVWWCFLFTTPRMQELLHLGTHNVNCALQYNHQKQYVNKLHHNELEVYYKPLVNKPGGMSGICQEISFWCLGGNHYFILQVLLRVLAMIIQ